MFFGVFVDTSKSLIYKLLLIIWLIFRWYNTLCGILEFNFDAHNTGGPRFTTSSTYIVSLLSLLKPLFQFIKKVLVFL